MASFAAARSVLRSAAASGRGTTTRLCASGAASGKPRASPSPFRVSSQKPLSARGFRSPVELSCVSAMSMQPYYSATASAVLTSMLSVDSCSRAWTLDGRGVFTGTCDFPVWIVIAACRLIFGLNTVQI